MMKLFFNFKIIDKSVKNYKYGSSSVSRMPVLGAGGRRSGTCLPYETLGAYPVISSGPLCKSGG